MSISSLSISNTQVVPSFKEPSLMAEEANSAFKLAFDAYDKEAMLQALKQGADINTLMTVNRSNAALFAPLCIKYQDAEFLAFDEELPTFLSPTIYFDDESVKELRELNDETINAKLDQVLAKMALGYQPTIQDVVTIRLEDAAFEISEFSDPIHPVIFALALGDFDFASQLVEAAGDDLVFPWGSEVYLLYNVDKFQRALEFLEQHKATFLDFDTTMGMS